jgi:Spy/CpxP family protein refolding chaperone
MKTTVKTTLLVVVATLALLSTQAVCAAEDADIKATIDMFRANYSKAKHDAVASALNLTDAEAKVFWPVYSEFETELVKCAEQKLTILRDLAIAQNDGTMDDAKARALTKKWFALQQKRLDLWQKYSGKIEKAVSATRAAQFLQVEYRTSLYADLGIVSQAPMITAPSPAPAP